MTPGIRGWIVLAIMALALFLTWAVPHAFAQAPGHEHHSAAGKFYQTWMMPDARHASCCSDKDCGPAQARMVDGHWETRWTDDDEWTRVPDNKVEHDRDTPDGSAHMCGRKSQAGEIYIYCFITGGAS